MLAFGALLCSLTSASGINLAFIKQPCSAALGVRDGGVVWD